jgi:hypothetical protein
LKFSGETVPLIDNVERGGFMRRYLTLVCLLCLAIPAGISVSGCSRNPGANYCNGSGYGLKITEVSKITLEPETTGISLAYGQTKQVTAPTAVNCNQGTVSVSTYTYGTTNNQLVDISPAGSICAGTWNRNTGGGIANYTICSAPTTLPSTGGLPYATAYITASAQSVTSNPVTVYVHTPVTSVALVGPSSCISQGDTAQLDEQACYSQTTNGVSSQVLLCAPSSVTDNSTATLACDLPSGIARSAIPACTSAIGTPSFSVGTSTVATLNSTTNAITAVMPGTTLITATLTGVGSTAGFFSTCPPKSIAITLNGKSGADNPVTVTHGITQTMVTEVTDTAGKAISGLTLDYQSTDPVDITASSSGSITTSFPGTASVYAICQPSTCNPAPTSEIGVNGTGLPIASVPVVIKTPGTTSNYAWFGAPGNSRYIVPVELLNGSVGSTIKLPFVPNSMIMDRTATSIYMGSDTKLMTLSTTSNAVSSTSSVFGVVLAVSPNNQMVLVNDQKSGTFYIYNVSGSIASSTKGMGAAAAWTPDSKTLYITDSAALGTGHSDNLYVYNANTSWTVQSLPCSVYDKTSCPSPTIGAQNLAVTIPSVGAYLSGSPTTAHTWCPTGTAGGTLNYYPASGDSIPAETDVLAATTDGNHILGAAVSSGQVTISDIGVQIPTTACGVVTNSTTGVQTLPTPLSTGGTLLTSPPLSVNVSATAINQVVTSPVSNLAFITYTGDATGASLPYYVPGTSSTAGTLGYVSLTGSSNITAPVAGAFTPDDSIFFVSTAGDNKIHYISVPSAVTTKTPLTDTQQISPNLPACTSADTGCTYSGTDLVVPATYIAVKPRTTT